MAREEVRRSLGRRAPGGPRAQGHVGRRAGLVAAGGVHLRGALSAQALERRVDPGEVREARGAREGAGPAHAEARQGVRRHRERGPERLAGEVRGDVARPEPDLHRVLAAGHAHLGRRADPHRLLHQAVHGEAVDGDRDRLLVADRRPLGAGAARERGEKGQPESATAHAGRYSETHAGPQDGIAGQVSLPEWGLQTSALRPRVAAGPADLPLAFALALAPARGSRPAREIEGRGKSRASPQVRVPGPWSGRIA